MQAGSLGRCGRVVLPQGQCAPPGSGFADKSRSDYLLPFFFSSVLSLEISFLSQRSPSCLFRNDINEFRLFVAALGLRCCVEVSGALELGPRPQGCLAPAVAIRCCLERVSLVGAQV